MASRDIKEVVKEKYGEAARRVTAGEKGGCGCGASAIPCCDPISSNLYALGETAWVRQSHGPSEIRGRGTCAGFGLGRGD